jgi:hypothetical protein
MEEYHTLMQQMTSMGALDVWYQHIDIGQIMELAKPKQQQVY